MEKLAILGGSKTILKDTPHYVWPIITKNTEKVVLEQLHTSISVYDRSGVLKEFEDKFAKYHNVDYSLLCNSGTMALYSMYKSVGLNVGDEVIFPVYTFFATVTPALFCGVVPLFCDCDSQGNISVENIEKLITKKTKAIVVTHMWGLPCDMDSVVDICNKYQLILLEDCSHAHGAKFQNQRVGTFGLASAWSLQGQKIISGGEGGILTTNNKNVYDNAQLLGHYNKRCIKEVAKENPLYEFATTGFGLKLRSHPIAVAIANEQFDNLDKWLETKHKYALNIINELSTIPFLEFPNFMKKTPSWYALIIKFNSEKANGISINQFIKVLHQEGLVEVDIPKSTAPLNIYPIFDKPDIMFPEFYSNNTSFIKGIQFPCADEFYNSTFKLPVWATEFDEEIVQLYIKGIKKVAHFVLNNPSILKSI